MKQDTIVSSPKVVANLLSPFKGIFSGTRRNTIYLFCTWLVTQLNDKRITCREGDMYACLAIQWLVVISRWKSQRAIHSRQVRYQFIDPEELRGVGCPHGKSEPGTWYRAPPPTSVNARVVSSIMGANFLSSDCVPGNISSPEFMFCALHSLIGDFDARSFDSAVTLNGVMAQYDRAGKSPDSCNVWRRIWRGWRGNSSSCMGYKNASESCLCTAAFAGLTTPL